MLCIPVLIYVTIPICFSMVSGPVMVGVCAMMTVALVRGTMVGPVPVVLGYGVAGIGVVRTSNHVVMRLLVALVRGAEAMNVN